MEEKHWNLIVDHLDGSLTSEQEQELAQKRLQDPEVEWEVQVGEQLKEVICRSAINEQLKDVQAEFSEQKSARTNFSTWSRWAVAACMVISLGWYLQLSPQSLYGEMYSTPDIYSFRGVEESANADLLQAYRQQEWEQVISFQSSGRVASEEALLLAAIARLEMGQSDESLKLLDLKTNWGEWTPVVEWYEAMALLQSGETDQAYQRLKAIADNPEHAYHKRVTNWQLFKLRVL